MSGFSARIILRLSILAALVLGSGCAGPRVYTNQDPNADFSAYRTYGFAPMLGTDTDQNGSLLSQFLKTATIRELEARGYEPSSAPDLLVDFYVHSEEKTRVSRAPRTYYGYHRRGHWGRHGHRGGYAGYETIVSQYTEGTLNVDIIDSRRRQVVWETALISRVTYGDVENMQEVVDEAIAQVFEEYPFLAG